MVGQQILALLIGVRVPASEREGPLAHLVERIHGMDEVAGSSPAWSTFNSFRYSNYPIKSKNQKETYLVNLLN